MLTKQQVSWKNEHNAKVWCNLKGYKFLSYGAFDVYYRTSKQTGVMVQGLSGKYEAYSSINWLDLFKDMQENNQTLKEIK